MYVVSLSRYQAIVIVATKKRPDTTSLNTEPQQTLKIDSRLKFLRSTYMLPVLISSFQPLILFTLSR